MFNSIRKKITFIFIILAFIITAMFTGVSIYQVKDGMETQMKYDGITLANNIKNNIKHIGVDNITEVQHVIEETYDASNGKLYYIGMVSPEKILVAGTSTDSIGEKIESQEIESVFKGETVSFMNEWKGVSAFNVTVPIKEGNRVVSSISVAISLEDMLSEIGQSIIKSLTIGIIVLLLASIFGFIMGKKLGSPLEGLTDTVEKIGEGDLTLQYTVKSKDEIGKLAKANNETVDNIRKLVKKVKTISHSLNNLSNDISTGGAQVSAASEEIAASITNVSEEGIKQTEALESSVVLLDSFSKDLNAVNKKLNRLSEKGHFIRDDANNGANNIKELSNTINGMEESFNVVRNKVDDLNTRVSQINSIVEVINNVAAQTNLLALNASIEAARAGESGKGFAVVAEEIRKLAEEVLSSSKSITELVNTVLSETKDVLVTTEEASDKVGAGKNTVEISVQSFQTIVDEVNEIPIGIDEVSKVLTGTLENKNKIVHTIEGIAANSEEIASMSEEVTASTEEQAAVTQELSVAAKKLVNMSNALEKSISKFTV